MGNRMIKGIGKMLGYTVRGLFLMAAHVWTSMETGVLKKYHPVVERKLSLTICQMLAVSDCMQALVDGTCPNEYGCGGCVYKERFEEDD